MGIKNLVNKKGKEEGEVIANAHKFCWKSESKYPMGQQSPLYEDFEFVKTDMGIGVIIFVLYEGK